MSGLASGPNDTARSPGLGRGTGHRFGSGWISSVLAVTCGALGYGGVLCLLFPSWLTTPSARALYPMDLVRFLIYVMLVLGFGLGALSFVLRHRKILGFTGIALATAGSLLGGSTAEVGTLGGTTAVGLDWFLLNLFILALVFVPIERVMPRLREQAIFRHGWTTDLMHFAMSHLLVQVTVVLTMLPAALFFRWATHPCPGRGGVPTAGAAVRRDRARRRLHPVLGASGLPSRALVLAPPRHPPLVGDARLAGRLAPAPDRYRRDARALVRAALRAGLRAAGRLRVSRLRLFLAVFIHADVRFDLRALDWVLVTPRLHHWHHAASPVDKNFAVHLPWLDRLFGTAHLPAGRWPEVYGIEEHLVPEGYWRQLVWPFRP